MTIKRGSEFKCTVESLGFGGKGVARYEGMAIFVKGGVPGDYVLAQAGKVKKRWAEAEIVRVIEPSEQRVEPQCSHFGTCGGCVLQHVDHETQVLEKQQQVLDAVKRIGGMEADHVLEPVPAPQVWRYRNKMEFVFEGKGNDFRLGLRAHGEKGLPPVIAIDDCHLCSETVMAVKHFVNDFCASRNIPAYDPRNRKGFLRHLIIRQVGRHSGNEQIMVHMISSGYKRYYENMERLGRLLKTEFPQVASFVHSIRRSNRLLAFGENVQFSTGADHVVEQLGGGEDMVRYQLGTDTFFQTSTLGATNLYNAVRDMCGLSGEELVLDLYCGAGGIGLWLAQYAGEVVGLELSEQSVEDATNNAEINGFENCEFHAVNLEETVKLPEGFQPDLIVCDPPRSGMAEGAIKAVLDLNAPRVVLVSCDPATLGRDLKTLGENYKLSAIRAVDMFPHTHHVETVALLERK